MLPSAMSKDSLAIETELDKEMASLQKQIASLKAQRELQATAILSAHTAQSILARLQASKSVEKSVPQGSKPDSQQPIYGDPLSTAISTQQSHTRSNLYRACVSVTTFRIQDPDPYAVDGGRILAIRIDVSTSGKFVRPYYVMLNKPFRGEDSLRIHRHTVPPCIPIATFAAQYLAPPKVDGDDVNPGKQDLRRFTRSLRRELVSYHNRTSTLKSLRKEFKLDDKPGAKGKGRERVIIDIAAADAEAKQVRIEWIDGRIGRCVVGDKGELVKCVVVGEDGRDREIERRILREGSRMKHIGERLREGIY